MNSQPWTYTDPRADNSDQFRYTSQSLQYQAHHSGTMSQDSWKYPLVAGPSYEEQRASQGRSMSTAGRILRDLAEIAVVAEKITEAIKVFLEEGQSMATRIGRRLSFKEPAIITLLKEIATLAESAGNRASKDEYYQGIERNRLVIASKSVTRRLEEMGAYFSVLVKEKGTKFLWDRLHEHIDDLHFAMGRIMWGLERATGRMVWALEDRTKFSLEEWKCARGELKDVILFIDEANGKVIPKRTSYPSYPSYPGI